MTENTSYSLLISHESNLLSYFASPYSPSSPKSCSPHQSSTTLYISGNNHINNHNLNTCQNRSSNSLMPSTRCFSLRNVFLSVLTMCILLVFYRGAPWPNSVKPEVLAVWSPGRSRNITEYVRPSQSTALLLPLESCTATPSEQFFIVFVVPSKPGNVMQRNAIRDTWGQWINTNKHRRKREALKNNALSGTESNCTAGALQCGGEEYDTEDYYVIWEEYFDDEKTNSSVNKKLNKRQTVEEEQVTAATTLQVPKKSKKVAVPRKSNNFATLDPSLKLKLVFLLGREEGLWEPSKAILMEHDKFGDIIMEDFIDRYQNLTLKSVFLLKFIRNSCPNTKFIAKIDDDIFLNVPNLQKTLLNKKLPKDLMLGCLFCNARPIQNPWNKWYSPKYMFREEKFPNYLSGTSYVISNSIVERLLDAAQDTPLFHLEDVFITGILSQKLGIRPVDDIGFSYQTRAINPCLYQNVTVGHEVKPGPMRKLWTQLHQPGRRRSCGPLTAQQIRRYSPTNCVWR